ncbi:MAG: hypothetical protein P8Q92_09170 [Pseudoprimorskyibacter sp.]|nr:hypothetical protein [Pseudoprimorskyibacter sp.]
MGLDLIGTLDPEKPNDIPIPVPYHSAAAVHEWYQAQLKAYQDYYESRALGSIPESLTESPSSSGDDDQITKDPVEGLCCTNPTGDSLFESSMIAGGYEQLGPYKIQDHELVCLQ